MLARPANEVRTTSGGKEKAAKYCPRGGAFRNLINNSHEENRANKTSRRKKKGASRQKWRGTPPVPRQVPWEFNIGRVSNMDAALGAA